MNWRDHIHSDPDILGGKPAIRGTRISVELVLEFLAEGADIPEMLDAYDHLTEPEVTASIAFAHHLMVEQSKSAQRQAA